MHTSKLYYPMNPSHHQHGTMMPTHSHAQGFCQSCCHPVAKCCCGSRECRKESKELLVFPETAVGGAKTISHLHTESLRMMDMVTKTVVRDQPEPDAAGATNETATNFTVRSATLLSAVEREGATIGTGKTFIGGGCCVYLSIEYMPSPGVSDSTKAVILVSVVDSEQTVMMWGKSVKPGTSYQIKECIISTKPGALLQVVVLNATARVRWCEVFSC